MMPIGDDNSGRHITPVVTWLLIAINIIVFILELTSNDPDAFIRTWGAIPREVVRDGEWHTLLSSMFMHGGIGHIFGNMMFLFVFGDNVEDALGHGKFLLFYLLTGFAAHAAHIALNADSMIPTVGASGAISGILGAYIVMFHTNRVRVWVGFFITTVPAWMMIGLWAAQQFFLTYAGEIARTEETTGGVAYAAHAGGFLAGVILAFILRGRRADLVTRRERMAEY